MLPTSLRICARCDDHSRRLTNQCSNSDLSIDWCICSHRHWIKSVNLIQLATEHILQSITKFEFEHCKWLASHRRAGAARFVRPLERHAHRATPREQTAQRLHVDIEDRRQ